MKNQKKAGDMAGKKAAHEKHGGDLSLLVDMFGPNARKWVLRGAWTLLGLLLAVIVGYQVQASRAAKVAKAEARLGAARTVEEFAQVATDFAGTVVGMQAELAAAQKLFDDGKYSEAGERFARAAAAKDDLVSLRGLAGQAHVAEAMAMAGDAPDKALLDQAMQQYAKAGAKASTLGLPGTQIDALLGQSRCARLQGDSAKARELAETARKLVDAPGHEMLARSLLPWTEGALRSLDTCELASLAPPKPEEPAEEEKAEEKTEEKPAEKPAE